MKIAVGFDGCGGSRLGLELAGHTCVGYEIDPLKHYLGKFVGSGNCILADITKVDLSGFDAAWMSPPCQSRSSARTEGAPKSPYAKDHLQWCLDLPHEILWVENIRSQTASENTWGICWNAAQFLEKPIQNRNRIIGGRYKLPHVFHPPKRAFKGVCPAITATEWKGCASDKRRASRFYGRKLTLEECAYHQGLEIPKEWYTNPPEFGLTNGDWKHNLYEAVGNAVPVYLAKAMGEAYK